MGRAIVREPRAFLMDEPLSNLDAKLRVQMRAEIARIQRRLGATTVYVTHDQTEAMTLGDEIVVMRDGVIQQRGTPKELYAHPQNLFVAGFIGAPSMNLMRAEVRDGSLITPLSTIPIGEELRRSLGGHTGEVIVGIRPEDFEDAEIVGAHRQGHTLSALVDVIEATGSDVYAHIALDDSKLLPSPVLAEEERTLLGVDVVARLDASSRLREGSQASLWLDTERLHVFDAESGERLHARS
jgi:multiple sugar transport system ATP-binding protein